MGEGAASRAKRRHIRDKAANKKADSGETPKRLQIQKGQTAT